jgi:hypothetical protein
MTARGSVAQLDRKPSGDPALAFWLVTSNEKIPVEAAKDAPIAEGDTVEVAGVTNSNGTLVADAIRKVSPGPAPRFPWKIAVPVVAVLGVGLGVYLFTRPSAKSTYTINATYCGKPLAGAPASMTNGSQTFNGTTNTQGSWTFTKLPAGTYSVRVGLGQRAGIAIDGKTAYPAVTINTSLVVLCVHPPLHPLDPNMLKIAPHVLKKTN